jgi:hypothetical protein
MNSPWRSVPVLLCCESAAAYQFEEYTIENIVVTASENQILEFATRAKGEGSVLKKTPEVSKPQILDFF